MSWVPRAFIRDLLDRADVAELVGGRVKLKRRGANWVGLCPFHNEKTPSFSVNPTKGFYHCFGCGAHGNALDFLTFHNGGDFLGAVEELAGRLGMTVPRETTGKSYERSPALLRSALDFWRQELHKSKVARDYLQTRGLQKETVERFQLGYAPDAWHGLSSALSDVAPAQLRAAGLLREGKRGDYDYFRHRLIFPILARANEPRGFGGRALGDEIPKYLNSAEGEGFAKGRMLFGLPQAATAAREKKRLIICEGYMDVVMLSQAGFAETVATMGTAATAEQMAAAVRAAANVVVAFDSDAAGEKGALRALESVLPALQDGVSVSFLFLPAGEDPDSYVRQRGSDAFEQALGGAESVSGFMARALAAKAESLGEDGRKSAVMKEGERLLRLMDGRRAPYLRELIGAQLAEQMAMRAAPLQAAVKRPVRAARSYLMRPESKLFILLCCLTALPKLSERLEEEGGNVPLPGDPMDTAIVAEVLAALRWNIEEETPTVPVILERCGQPRLAQQVRDSVERRFDAIKHVADEFSHLLALLRKAHERLSGSGKAAWLKQLPQRSPPSPSSE